MIRIASLVAATLLTLASGTPGASAPDTVDAGVRPQPEVPVCAYCSAGLADDAAGGTALEIQIAPTYAEAVTTIPIIFHLADGGSETFHLDRWEVASVNDPSAITVVTFPVEDVVAGSITFVMGREVVTEPIDIVAPVVRR